MLLISQNAKFEVGLGLVVEFYGSIETFILLGIDVLETDLEFNGFNKSSLGFLRRFEDAIDGFNEGIAREFARFAIKIVKKLLILF
jgi:hypothetical protein